MSEEKTPYSFVSSEKQRKNAAAILSLELGVLIVAILIIFFILNYLGIFPLSKMAPRIFGFLPVKPGVQKGVPVNPNDPIIRGNPQEPAIKVTPDISLVSDIKNASIKINDNEEFEAFVDQFDIFGKSYDKGNGDFSKVLKKLTIHLTDQVQTDNKYFLTEKIPVTSSGYVFKDNNLDLYIHLSPSAFNNKTTTPELFFEQGVLTATYRLANSTTGIKSDKEKNEELNSYLMRIDPKKDRLVDITIK